VGYQIRYTDEARRALPGLPGNYRQRVRREIEALADNPRPAKAVRLRNGPGRVHSPERYKIVLDKWRIIYRVIEDEKMVRILRIRIKTGPETYQDLPE
jgi:mRNA interferase RelE/StbE